MTKPWDAPSALAVLLDALEADLLVAPMQEVRTALRETSRARESAICELRSLLRDVQAADHDRCSPTPLPDDHDGMNGQRH